jgi:hypothetical protein
VIILTYRTISFVSRHFVIPCGIHYLLVFVVAVKGVVIVKFTQLSVVIPKEAITAQQPILGPNLSSE